MLDYQKILVPVDFTQISESAIIRAARHSEASNSQLLVVHIVDDYLSTGNIEHKVQQAEVEVTELLNRLEIGYCDKFVQSGDPVESLLEVIQDEKADLVVMGTHKEGPSSAIIQSITIEVVTSTECDVLVLHK